MTILLILLKSMNDVVKPPATGSRALQDPKLLQACISLLGEGLTVWQVAEQLHTSPRVVAIVDAQYGPDITKRKSLLANHVTRLAQYSAQKYEDELLDGKIKPDQLPIHLGILVDKALVLTGQANCIIQHKSDKIDLSLPVLDTACVLEDTQPVKDADIIPDPNQSKPLA